MRRIGPVRRWCASSTTSTWPRVIADDWRGKTSLFVGTLNGRIHRISIDDG
jgi:hypothetical protein